MKSWDCSDGDRKSLRQEAEERRRRGRSIVATSSYCSSSPFVYKSSEDHHTYNNSNSNLIQGGSQGLTVGERRKMQASSLIDKQHEQHPLYVSTATCSTVGTRESTSPAPASCSSSSTSSNSYSWSPQPAPLCWSSPVLLPINSSAGSANANTNDLVSDARQEWRLHGEGATQVLEDKRLLLSHANSATGANSSGGCGVIVRVISAQEKVDQSGCKYTSYIIQVQQQHTPPSSLLLESSVSPSSMPSSFEVTHRYSDFCKLNSLLTKYTDVYQMIPVVFPSKHWAGRMGSWTPAQLLLPDKYNELISKRIRQLDIWLVHVVQLYNTNQLPLQIAQAVYEFLWTPNKHQLPPCHSTYNNHILFNQTDKNTDKISVNNDSNNRASLLASLSIQQRLKWSNPVSFTLGSSIRQACLTVQYMMFPNSNNNSTSSNIKNLPPNNKKIPSMEQTIPLDLLQKAKGLCFMTVFKAGMVVSGRIGTGLVISRLDDDNIDNNTDPRWSAPCAVGTIGLGYGAVIGGDITHYLIVLTTQKAVYDLCSTFNNKEGGSGIQLGAELDIAIGPIGRGATSQLTTGDWTIHQAYSYGHSQGFFFGMSLEGSIISVRNDVNKKFYQSPHEEPFEQQHQRLSIQPKDILQRPGPKAAEPLYNVLNMALQQQIPSTHDFLRPSQLFSSSSTSNIHNNNQISTVNASN